MTHIERKLWFEADGLERRCISESQILALNKPLVILGEPGMGKSELLRKLAENSKSRFLTARQLINRPDPQTLLCGSSIAIIDAIDEVAAKREGDAVDLVIQKLGILGYPRFILSCRVGDWRSATSVRAITEQYAVEPLQLHLVPLDREDQKEILSEKMGAPDAKRILSHFESFGLDFLGNPQTLELVARLPSTEPLPNNSEELFDRAVEILRLEHRDTNGQSELSRQAALEAAGAAFASLILTGCASISRRASANLADGEIQFSEVDTLANRNLERVITTRLFSGTADSFSYWHRRIGEFLGARWLAKQANTARKRKRLLKLFQSNGLVPANLRGLHAWLASDAHLARQVIAVDPLGVIEYGDADTLTPQKAKKLLSSLQQLARANPHFRILPQARASSLVQPELCHDVTLILKDKNAAFGLRMLLAQQIARPIKVKAYRETLRELLFDQLDDFALRRLSGIALFLLGGEDWVQNLEILRSQATQDSIRLAFELMQNFGLALFSDKQVVEITLAHAGLTPCPIQKEGQRRLLIRFWRFENEVPEDRQESLLDMFLLYLSEVFPKNGGGFDGDQIVEFIHRLILRCLQCGSVDPLKIWRWLEPYEDHHGYGREAGKELAAWFNEHDDERRAIQHHVLLDSNNEPMRMKAKRLSRRTTGLFPNESDVVALLERLDPSDYQDLRWREVSKLVEHDAVRGLAVREAARPFVAHDRQMQEWLENLSEPRTPQWEIEEEKNARKREAKREAKFKAHREDYSKNVEKIRSGVIGWVHEPAQAYLKGVSYIGVDLPAHERISEWLGAEISQAAHEGFEAFLTSRPVRPTAAQVAVSFAQDRKWNAGDIIVAALAERLRTWPEPFAKLPDERLMVGLFVLWDSRIGDHAGFPELIEQVEMELRRRDVLEVAHRIYITPQLKQRRMHVDMYHLMHSEKDADLASKLAIDWLQHCGEIASQPEAEMIDCVLASALRERLGSIGDTRRLSVACDKRRRNWDAVQILVDFEAARLRLGSQIEPDLLWNLRARAGGQCQEGSSSFPFSPKQIEWIVSVFRGLWPVVNRPNGLTVGVTNPWDASKFIFAIIVKLGKDVSPEAVSVIANLRDAQADSYTNHLREVAAEQKQKRVEQFYVPPTLQQLSAIVNAGAPGDSSDLQAIMIDALDAVQAQLRGSNIDWYRGFYSDEGQHKNEEPCRDELIKMLQTIEPNLEYIPESHAADDKRVDIVVRANAELILPIEVKGQWHKDLWTAADKQLDHLYINDWRAKRGIYLVFWFGPDVKITPVPDGSDRPVNPDELKAKLCDLSKAALANRLDVVILDLSRPRSL